MPTTKRITVAPRIAEQITVDLAGKEYIIQEPKATLGMIMADRMQSAGQDASQILVELESWITTVFGPKQGPKVWARVLDPADDIDIPQVVDLIQQLTEAATPNPTT